MWKSLACDKMCCSALRHNHPFQCHERKATPLNATQCKAVQYQCAVSLCSSSERNRHGMCCTSEIFRASSGGVFTSKPALSFSFSQLATELRVLGFRRVRFWVLKISCPDTSMKVHDCRSLFLFAGEGRGLSPSLRVSAPYIRVGVEGLAVSRYWAVCDPP